MKWASRRRQPSALEELEHHLTPQTGIVTVKERPTMSIPPFIIKATAIVSLGGILFGYDMGVISGALPQLKQEFNLSERQQESVVGILYLGAGLGACFGGNICDKLGRRTGILSTDLIFIAGAAVLFYATSVDLLYFGRFVVGFGVSVSGIADVAYLHEMAPLAWRGSLVSVNEGCISLGFLLAFVTGFVWREHKDGWRYMFGLCGIMAFIQLVGMSTMPESPVWLQQQGRLEERQAVLRIIYEGDEQQIPTDDESQGELKYIQGSPKSPSSHQMVPTDRYNDPLSSPAPSTIPIEHTQHRFQAMVRYRKQGMVALFLAIFQQLSGHSSVLNYTPLLFSSFDKNNTMIMVQMGVVKLIVTILVIWKIEYLGRRFLLFFGMSLLVIGQCLIVMAFQRGVSSMEEESASGVGWAIPGVLCVVMGYSASFGPLTWLLTSELFPPSIRGRALGIVTVVTYLMASLTTSTFLSLQSKVGPSIVFGAYGIMTALGLVFVFLAIPDTGGKSVEEIDSSLCEMWWWRRRRRRSDSPLKIIGTFGAYSSETDVLT
jgi:MFS family permease